MFVWRESKCVLIRILSTGSSQIILETILQLQLVVSIVIPLRVGPIYVSRILLDLSSQVFKWVFPAFQQTRNVIGKRQCKKASEDKQEEDSNPDW